MAILDIGVLWNVVADIFENRRVRNNNTINALGAVRNAFNHTFDYLRNQNGQYAPNMNLAILWNDASTAVMRVDPDLGDMLARKSRFWTHPDIYIQLNNVENIIELNRVIDEMERLRLRIR